MVVPAAEANDTYNFCFVASSNSKAILRKNEINKTENEFQEYCCIQGDFIEHAVPSGGWMTYNYIKFKTYFILLFWTIGRTESKYNKLKTTNNQRTTCGWWRLLRFYFIDVLRLSNSLHRSYSFNVLSRSLSPSFSFSSIFYAPNIGSVPFDL